MMDAKPGDAVVAVGAFRSSGLGSSHLCQVSQIDEYFRSLLDQD